MSLSDLLSPSRSAIDSYISQAFSRFDWMADLPGDRQDLHELLAPALSLMSTGKRTRGLLLIAAARCSQKYREDSAIAAATALEFYQGSALIHDDIIDHALTRRSRPSTHIEFTRVHEKYSWMGDSSHFGTSAAILLGDLLLSFSHEAMIQSDPSPEALLSFTRMTSEVSFGQYLDIKAEAEGNSANSLGTALRVLTHKSARYSVVFPLIIGAQLAGLSPEITAVLRDIGTPLGEAFQLRDDELGIFGSSEITGKPVCGDISEGKRTALVALSLQALSSDDATYFQSLLGREINEKETAWVQEKIRACGALERHATLIHEREQAAIQAWNRLRSLAHVQSEGIDMLGQLLDMLEKRKG